MFIIKVGKYRENVKLREQVREFLRYDPITGKFFWLKRTSPRSTRIKIGGKAGCYDNYGYIIIRINNKKL